METAALIRRLADGRPHSGERLAGEFGVTRAAIWKRVRKLAELGLTVDAERGSGYRLRRPLKLLEQDAIERCFAGARPQVLGRLEIHGELDSTNRSLLERPPPPGRLDVCIAEFQTAGRGRRGRRWTTPFGAAVSLSAGWLFSETPAELTALTLAVGVAAHRALQRATSLEPKLKWPNDLVLEERKLGGILVELNAESQGRCHVVAGIGINVDVGADALAGLSDWPRGAIDVATVLGRPPDRAPLVAALVTELAELFPAYTADGFAPYRDAWARLDHLYRRPVRVTTAAGERLGTAEGIDADGALRLRVADGGIERILSGDVSVRSGA